MTQQKFLNLSDVALKVITPLLFAILAWNANRIVEKMDKLDEGFSTVRIAIERHETRIVSFDEMLKEHIRSTNGANNPQLLRVP